MWYDTEKKDKVLFVVRGLSGSGKSTLSKELAGDNGQIFSTDNFFIKDGVYDFKPSKLGLAHEANFQETIKAINAGVTPIVVDNTNVEAWESKRYVKYAVDNGYRVEIREPDTPWKFDAEELAKRNTHGVPISTIQKTLNRWEPDLTVEKILESKSPFEKK